MTIFIKWDDINVSEELDFLQAAQVLKADATEPRSKLDKTFYKLLEKNSEMLTRSTSGRFGMVLCRVF